MSSALDSKKNDTEKKTVTFAVLGFCTFYSEDSDLKEELRAYRYHLSAERLDRQRAKDQAEKILSPVLQPEHRAKIFRRLFEHQ